MEKKQLPVKVGDILKDVEVISEGKRKDGVIKYEGYIIFCENCSKGDIVTVKIEKILPNFGLGIKVDDEEEKPVEGVNDDN